MCLSLSPWDLFYSYWNHAGPWGAPEHINLSVFPVSYLLGNRIQPPWLPWVWNCRFKQLLTGKGGDAEIREKQPGNNHTTLRLPQIPKLGFRSAWALNLQMFKLVLEMEEEPEIKLPTCAGSSKKEESSRETSISALLTTPKPLTVWITINCGKFWKRWAYQTTWPPFWETCMQVRKQQWELDMEQQTDSK